MRIDRGSTALLVIDVLEGGVSDSVYDPQVADFAERCGRVTTACRGAGLPVVLCCDAHRKGSDAELALWGDHGLAGTPEARPAACLDVSPTDIVIPKRRYDSFFQTDLDITLRELGVTNVIAIGCDTNICVLQTLAGAFYRGLSSVLVTDATRTFLVGTQEGAETYARRCFGSELVTCEELYAALA